MKKASGREQRSSRQDMRKEYRFDYELARPNRFASRIRSGSIAVFLDPDVASVFGDSESVNALLRSVISALPSESKSRRVKKPVASGV